jgi:hypothetical protein
MVETPAWFQQQHAQAPLSSVAYFSMEFMLNEALPIYSGGLSLGRPLRWLSSACAKPSGRMLEAPVAPA